MKAISCVLVASLAVAGQARGQAPPEVLVQALQSRLGGPGGCFGLPDTARVQISFFPSVTFLRGECIFEHGDPASAIVGTDSTGTLFLLGDEVGFQYFLDEHAPSAVDTAQLIQYTLTLLELRGFTTKYTTYIPALTSLPVTARRALRKVREPNRRTWCVPPTCGTFVLTATPGWQSDIVEVYTAMFSAPTLVLIDRTAVWEGPQITRFALPRTAPDSQLAAAARGIGLDYAERYAQASLKKSPGLGELMDITGVLPREVAGTHVQVLFELLTRWGDAGFARELGRRSPATQRATMAQLTRALEPGETWRWFPHMARLAERLLADGAS